MHRKTDLLAFLILTFLVATPIFAEGSLWLFPDEALPEALEDGWEDNPLYVDESDNPWLDESWVVEPGPFTLDVYNHARGNGDLTAYDVRLLVAVSDPSLVTSGTITVGDETFAIDESSFTLGTPRFECSGGDLPRHGVYPAPYTIIPVGDIAADDIAQIEVDLGAGEDLIVHFDATGYGMKTVAGEEACHDVFTPFGHDLAMAGDDATEGEEGCMPELTVRKDVDPEDAGPGDDVSFLISVNNPSECDAAEVFVTDTIGTVAIGGSDEPSFLITSSDPAPDSDDGITQTWSLDSIAAGEVATFVMTATVNPLLGDGDEALNTACVQSASTGEECDDASIEIGEGEEDGELGGPGYWCNQIRFALEEKPNAQLELEDIEGWLKTVNDSSTVFDELVNTETVELADAFICDASSATDPDLKLMRHLLVLWFNVAAERVGADTTLDELCFGSEMLPDDADLSMTIADVIVAAEDALNDEADDATLLWWKDVVDAINNAQVAGSGSCLEAGMEMRSQRVNR